MKRILLATMLLGIGICAFALPKLSKDNIDEVLSAMTLEEKALLVTGSGWGLTMSGVGVPTGSALILPGAAGTYIANIASNVEDVSATASFKIAKAQSWKTNNALVPVNPINEITVK